MYKKINGKYEYKFSADKNGPYSIILEATCQKRNDLKVGIDEIKLRELPAEDNIQYYKIPPSWNGNELKGTSKTVVLILELIQGEHSLKFEVKGEAELLAEPKMNFLERKSLVAVLKNIQSPKKNRQPRVTAVLINLPLNFLDISAICRKRFLDSDDLQLIIDGEIQKHPGSLWWGKNWLWQGRLSKGRTETKRIYKKLDRGIHYIELWADVAPTVESFQLSLGVENSSEEHPKNIKQYTNKGPNGNYDYNRYDEIIRSVVDYWNKKFLNDKYPVENPLDPNLVKAIIFQESRIGYDKRNNGAINVMQVGNYGDDSLNILNGKGEKPEYELINEKIWKLDYKGEAIVNEVYDSVYWGVRWLYHKAQEVGADGKRYWSSWEKAVALYGPPEDKYIENVWDIYTQGIDNRTIPPLKLWMIAFLIFFVSGFGVFWQYDRHIKSMIFNGLAQEDKLWVQNIKTKYYRGNPALFLAEIVTYEDWSEDFEIGRYQGGEIAWLPINELPTENSIKGARFVNLPGFENPVVEVYGQTHVGHGAFYLYEIENDEAKLILESRAAVDMNNDARWAPDNFEKYGYTECGEIYRDGKLKSSYEDMNGDRVADVVLSGTEETVCEARVGDEKEEWISDDVKMAESEVRKVFLWDKEKGKFFEQKQVALEN